MAGFPKASRDVDGSLANNVQAKLFWAFVRELERIREKIDTNGLVSEGISPHLPLDLPTKRFQLV